jgi:LysM repeat protein
LKNEVTQNETVVAEEEVDNRIVESTVTRKVLPKETKYGIAKEYGISVKRIRKTEPRIVKSM